MYKNAQKVNEPLWAAADKYSQTFKAPAPITSLGGWVQWCKSSDVNVINQSK